MAKITAITTQQKNKDRVNLFIDDEFFSGLSLETVMLNRLKVDMEVDSNKLKEIVEQSERTDALNKALNYISKTLKTKIQVKDYLVKKGYSLEVAWYCVDKLKDYKFIDDKEYSKKYIECNSKSQGKRLFSYKLMEKGVRKEDIEKALEESEIDLKECAFNTAQKYLKNKEITKEILVKTYRYLIGRGFSYEETDYAISKFKDEDWWKEYLP